MTNRIAPVKKTIGLEGLGDLLDLLSDAKKVRDRVKEVVEAEKAAADAYQKNEALANAVDRREVVLGEQAAEIAKTREKIEDDQKALSVEKDRIKADREAADARIREADRKEDLLVQAENDIRLAAEAKARSEAETEKGRQMQAEAEEKMRKAEDLARRAGLEFERQAGSV